MKKMVLLVISAVTIASFTSCKDKSCYYDDQEYNSNTKQCECVQMMDIDNIPALKHDDYNTVLTVYQNFYYASVDNKDYPYYSHEGDTILLSGYLGDVPEYILENGEYLYSIGDDSAIMAEQYSAGYLAVRCSDMQLKDIDIYEKCFVRGILSFGFSDFQYESFPGPGRCLSPRLFFSVVDIKN